MAIINVKVIDESEPDVTMWLEGAATIGEIGIKSVRDMVTKLLALCGTKDNHRIRELRICGHGNRQGQRIGADFVTMGSVEQHAKDLTLLSPVFSAGAMVFMTGCKVGQAEGLILRLSELMNVRVRGFTATQRIGVDLGGSTTCYPRYVACTRTDPTLADDFDVFDDEYINPYVRQPIVNTGRAIKGLFR